jgi:hypothetical protein
MNMFASHVVNLLPSSSNSGKTGLGRRREQSMTLHHFVRSGSCLGDGPPVDVTQWRLCRLVDAGFPRDLAERLAAAPGVDVHALLALVDRGCPPELAARILSPLPEPWMRR